MVGRICLIAAALAVSAVASEHAAPPPSGDIGTLITGNGRYVAAAPGHHAVSAEDRAQMAKGQAPYAVVVTCSDSRCGPEMIFDEGLGRIFVVRTAGNVLDSITLGSIEYALEHLGAPLVMVLGHESCGAVKATVGALSAKPGEGGEVPPNIMAIVNRILPAAKKAKAQLREGEDLVFKSTTENVRMVIASMLKNSSVIKEMKEKGSIKIVGAYYSIADGTVKKVE